MSPKPRMSPRRIVALSLIVLAALAALWLVVAVGVAGVTRYRVPALALRVMPGDARALAAQAAVGLTPQLKATDLATAERLAKESIARDPTVSVPWRVLGFVADARRNQALAARFMMRSEQLSRRDFPTQLWLIEYAVARDDVAGALRQFDVALRTSNLAPQLLFPVLREAISDERLLPPIARILASNPAWRPRFLRDAIDNSSSFDGLAGLALALRQVGSPLDDDQRQQLDNRLIAGRAFAQLKRVNRLPTNGQFVLDPGFERDRVPYRFGWYLPSGDGPFVERVAAASGKGNRLQFTDSDGGGGLVAQQVLTLPPGSYRIRFDAAMEMDSLGSRPIWGVNCGDRNGAAVATIPITVPRGGGSQAATFTVPAANCTGQLLTLVARPNGSEQRATGWVDNVTIVAN